MKKNETTKATPKVVRGPEIYRLDGRMVESRWFNDRALAEEVASILGGTIFESSPGIVWRVDLDLDVLTRSLAPRRLVLAGAPLGSLDRDLGGGGAMRTNEPDCYGCAMPIDPADLATIFGDTWHRACLDGATVRAEQAQYDARNERRPRGRRAEGTR